MTSGAARGAFRSRSGQRNTLNGMASVRPWVAFAAVALASSAVAATAQGGGRMHHAAVRSAPGGV